MYSEVATKTINVGWTFRMKKERNEWLRVGDGLSSNPGNVASMYFLFSKPD